MQDTEATKLFSKYQAGTCTEEEKAIVENWLTFGAATPFDLSDKELDQDLEDIRLAIPMFNQPKKINLWPRVGAAAAIFLIIGGGLFFFIRNTNGEKVSQYAQDLPPGGNKATLTLANGQEINLSDAANGDLVKQQGISITKAADGQLVYHVSDKDNAHTGQPEYNTITTPKGGQYQIVLPDGSKVWLNAASYLKFPSTFARLVNRKVELSGEAYFEVAKDKAHPFIVESNKQTVEVLGTHFNISSYPDEQLIKTTLLEGSVSVNKSGTKESALLKPGEQLQLSSNNMEIVAVDVQSEVAWKNGYFKFKDDRIEDIMQQLSRWYNIEVKYEGATTEELYSGRISRFKNISQVLNMIEDAQSVHFKIEGRRITVTK